ncbi:MAG: hypothetical protein JSS89_03685 [Bacteroidetes bacterium]|nr:hypothetical protein [Bacteroidota bacterium]
MNRCFNLCCALILASITSFAQGWTPVIPGRAVYGIAVNPQNPTTVFAGNVARTMFRSGDGGFTWEELSIQDISGTSRVALLVIHPTDTTIMFAGGPEFTGLDRSTDAGQTWSNSIKDPSGRRIEFTGTTSLCVHPTATDTVYALRSSPPIVYRSVNKGSTWDSLAIVDTVVGSRGNTIAVCPTPDSSNIIVAGGRGSIIYRSVNGGRTWTRTGRLSAQPDADAMVIKWSLVTPGLAYATASNLFVENTSNSGIFTSTDYGVNWARMRFMDTSLYALELHRTAVTEEIFVGGYQGDGSSATLKGDSIVMRSPNAGQQWASLGTVPWTENEVGKKRANVWSFGVTMAGGFPYLLLGSEAGAFMSTQVVSVHDGPSATGVGQLQLRHTDRGLAATVPTEFSGRCSYAISTLTGSLVASGSVTMYEQGSAVLATPSLASGLYVVRLTDGAHVASALIQW